MSRALALVALMHLSSMPSEHPFMIDVASHHLYIIVPRSKWGVIAHAGAPPPREPSNGQWANSRGAQRRQRDVAMYYVSNLLVGSPLSLPRSTRDLNLTHALSRSLADEQPYSLGRVGTAHN